MKVVVGFFMVAMVLGCTTENEQAIAIDAHEVEIPSVVWEVSEVFLDVKTSLWRSAQDSTPVSGRVMSFFEDGTISKCIPLYEGRREGVVLTYFPDGRLKFSECYVQNRLHGEVKRWVSEKTYQLVAELRYFEGKLHGEQRKWYATGELHQLLHLEDGQENGRQQAFRKNGALYANYEAKKGRIFGLKRTQLCYELVDEYVVYKQ